MSRLDPHRKFISRVLDRRHCIVRDDVYYIKDLRILKNRSLANLVIVDNMVFSFLAQLENGIYVPSYLGDDDDSELLILLPFLLSLKDVPDVRPLVRHFAGILPLQDIHSNHRMEEDKQQEPCLAPQSGTDILDCDELDEGNENDLD